MNNHVEELRAQSEPLRERYDSLEGMLAEILNYLGNAVYNVRDAHDIELRIKSIKLFQKRMKNIHEVAPTFAAYRKENGAASALWNSLAALSRQSHTEQDGQEVLETYANEVATQFNALIDLIRGEMASLAQKIY